MEPLMGKETSSINPSVSDKAMAKAENKIMGIVAKRETTVWNLFAIILAPTVAVTAGAYANAQMPYLLQSEDHFAI